MSMYAILSWIFLALYLALPVVGAIWLVRVGCLRRAMPVAMVFVMGSLVGAGLVNAASRTMGMPYPLTQYLITAYLGVSMVFLVKIFDIGVTRSIRWMVGWKNHRSSIWRAGVITLTRMVVFAAISLPWLLAALMTYRPRSGEGETPMMMLHYPFERVEFKATDGKPLVGWFIPAQDGTRRNQNSDKTVLICHGLGASKSNFLPMAGGFVPHGYNVFIFDFRAHGESAGQLTSFGDAERQDVSGAVAYLKSARPAQAREIHGLGISMGGAALIAAAAQDDPRAREIDSVCVISTYDSIQNEADDLLGLQFPHAIVPSLRRMGLVFASLHTGQNLNEFAPASVVDRLWPRPFLLIHGGQDPLIPVERGHALFDRAVLPKQALFIHDGDHMNMLSRSDILQAIREFFSQAERVPIVQND